MCIVLIFGGFLDGCGSGRKIGIGSGLQIMCTAFFGLVSIDKNTRTRAIPPKFLCLYLVISCT
jgi:hypothetical protein